jgi:PAS domain S-box-containing protein
MLEKHFLRNKLHDTEETLSAVFDLTIEAIIIQDEKHCIQKINQTTQTMLGYNKDEAHLILGRSVLDFIQASCHDRVKQIMAAQSNEPYEVKAVRKDGSTFPISITGKYIMIDGKQVRVATVLDLSEIKQAQSELENLNTLLRQKVAQEIEKNRLKDQELFHQSRLAQMGEMISMIAHQWRQPLSAIGSTVANIELKLSMKRYDLNNIKEQEACQNFVHKKLKNIDTYLQGLSHTIDDFKNFYKPDKEKKKITLSKPIKEALHIMNPSCIDHKIRIKKSLDSTHSISLYEREFMQVILNLLKNAQDQLLEKQIENPTIMIESFDEEDFSVVQISDNAGGVPPQYLEKLFDPYFSTKDEKNGTGLGLYMSKTIIESHHKGKIEVYNTEQGALFSIRIPSLPNIQKQTKHKSQSLEMLES